jgi:hypothetical protein
MRRVPHIVVAALLIVLAAANSYPADKEGFNRSSRRSR